MTFAVRSPDRADNEPLKALLESVWGPDPAVHRLGERYDLLRLPRLVITAGDGTMIGTAGWALLPPDFANDDTEGEWVLDLSEPPVMRGVLVDLAIAPDFRRRGAGTALLQAVLERLRQTGLSEVLTSLAPDDSDGGAFLRRAGFREADVASTVAAGPWPTEQILALALR